MPNSLGSPSSSARRNASLKLLGSAKKHDHEHNLASVLVRHGSTW